MDIGYWQATVHGATKRRTQMKRLSTQSGPNIQVPMQYCSLQHQILLLPPDTYTSEHCFCFGPATSFFLELLVTALRSLPSILGTFYLGAAHLSVSYLFAFHTICCVLMARIMEWVVVSTSSGPCFVKTLRSDPSTLGGPARHGS